MAICSERRGQVAVSPEASVKLVRKLIFAQGLAVFAVAALFAWFGIRREMELLDDDVRRDHAVIGATLGGSMAMTWRTEGPERALALVREADRLRTRIRLRWVWARALEDEHAPLVDLESAAPLKPGVPLHFPVRVRGEDSSLDLDPNGDEWLVSYAPVKTPSGRVGAIEMAQSLAPNRLYVQTTIVNVATAAGSLVAVSAALMLGLGVWLVGRPMGRLAEKARRVGAGDLSGPLELRQHDEIGELAAEMNAMCDRLTEANGAIRSETAARIATLEQLRHADRLTTVGKLAAGLAHELGTPLNVVSGRAKMVARGKTTPEETLEYAAIIAEQSDRMAAIIRQLLDYARVRSPRKATHELRGLVDQTLLLLKPLAEKRGVTLSLRDGSPLDCEVDRQQLQQALTNIVVNAIHASGDGSAVMLEVDRQTSNHDPSHPAEEHAVIRVEDQGDGMAPDTLDHIFDPFFTTKPIGEGSGLGLSVSQGIVREHGGSLGVESERGRGSTFSIHLPLPERA
jgi:two-component system, NtrC family, sensor kinase